MSGRIGSGVVGHKRCVIWLFLLFIGAGPVHAQSQLPTPEGPHAVGYWLGDLQTITVDELSPQRVPRRLGLSIWYPALPNTGTAKPWVSPAMGAALGSNFPFPQGIEARVTSHARLNATAQPGPWPVVIFSHGLSFPPALYQSHFEHLASQGFAVVAVSHPHGSALIEYPDGKRNTMERWPSFDQDQKTEAFLAEHVGVWASDLTQVLDWVQRGGSQSPLRGRIDVSRLALMGHSLGGTAVGRISADPRVKAVIIMEGLVRDPTHAKNRGILTVGAPTLHLIGGYNRLEHEGGQYAPSADAPVYQIVINGTGHAYFSDLIYLYQTFADKNWLARHRYEVEPRRVLQIVRDHSIEFLNRYLNGKPISTLLNPKSAADKVDSPTRAGYTEVDLAISVK